MPPRLASLGLVSCIAALCMAVTNSESVAHNCAYYMADSRVPGFGRGVFAGQALSENETMFDSITVLVRNVVAMETMLAYYVFTDENEDYEVGAQ